MRAGVALTIGLLLVASSGAAQDQRRIVTAGEYPGVSRLVISFPEPPDWVLGQTEAGLTLRLSGPSMSFDLTRVMPRLPAGRVTAIAPQNGGTELGMRLGCECGVRAYLMDDLYLVIDILDDAAAGNPAFAQALLPLDPVQAMTQAPDHPSAGPDDADPPMALYASGALGETAIVLENLRLTQAQLPDTGLSLDLPDPLPLLPAPEALAARQAITDALAGEIARASSLGLLEPELSAPSLGDLAPAPPTALAPSGNIRIDMGLDPATGVTPPPLQTPLPACPPPSALDVATWGGPLEGIWADVATVRSDLFDPFDMPRPDGVRDLARLYVYMTFGAEAQSLLAQLAVPSGDHDILSALATVIDNPASPTADALRAHQDCGSLARMWALLAGAAPPDVRVDTNGVLLQFSRLPRHLRLHLGPPLAARFLDLGQKDAALTVRNATPPPPFAGAPALQLIDARLAEEGLRPNAKTDLPGLARSTSPEAAAALIALIDQSIEIGRPVEAEIVDSAGLMAFERAGTPDAADLRAAEIRGRVSRNEYFLALETLDATLQSGVFDAAQAAQFRQEVYAAAVAQARDAAFAQLIFDPASQRFLSGAPSGLRLAVAARLADLGFASRAGQVLATLPDRDSADVRRIRARIALAEGRPEDAARVLSPPITADDAALVASADLAAGRFSDARDRCAQVDDPDCALRAALRARDWPGLRDTAPDPIAAAAGLAIAEEASERPAAPPTLAEAQELIDGARSARTQLDEMLRAVPGVARNGS
ncbi:MAG: hypothetical protein AAFQ79_01335 [Pseudomonadota bacterium]